MKAVISVDVEILEIKIEGISDNLDSVVEVSQDQIKIIIV